MAIDIAKLDAVLAEVGSTRSDLEAILGVKITECSPDSVKEDIWRILKDARFRVAAIRKYFPDAELTGIRPIPKGAPAPQGAQIRKRAR